MNSVSRIVSEMIEDINVIVCSKFGGDSDAEENIRIRSLASRVLGACNVVVGSALLGLAGVYAIAVITVSPIALIGVAILGATAAVCIVVGHDGFVTGNNIRKDLSTYDSNEAPFAKPSRRGSHPHFEGTWAFGPLYRFVNKI